MNTQEFRILLVDDDVELLRTTELLLKGSYSVRTAASVPAAKQIINQNDFDLVISDLNFEGHEFDGNNLIEWLAKSHPRVPVIVLSGDRDTGRVVLATQHSNKLDFVVKSARFHDELRIAIARAQNLKKRDATAPNAFLTNSQAIKDYLNLLQKPSFRESSCPVLITGETGTGKEEFAKCIAGLLGKKIVAANMGAIPRETAESELFGHKKGAFTGADRDKTGLITAAHGGIFFLDEIGEAGPDIQVKLLRVLQDKAVQPVGAVTSHKVDVRFISATNRNLRELACEGRFREDLLNRIDTITFCLPPLRERKEDIPLYAHLFLAEAIGSNNYSLNAGAVEALLEYKWPGNVRELRNVIQRMHVLGGSSAFGASEVRTAVVNMSKNSRIYARIDESKKLTYSEVLLTLEKSGGNQCKAAELLNVHRTTLNRFCKSHGLSQLFSAKPGRPTGAPRASL